MNDALGDAQRVVVLGGTSEIAQAIVRRLAARRTRSVVLAGRDPAAAEPFAAELRSGGADVTSIAFDAREPASHAAALGPVFDAGDVDVVILAFGVLGDQAAFEADPASAADAVAVNFGGAVSASLVVADRLKRQGHGTLVVLSSVAGVRVRKANAVYGATKAGLDGFALALGDSLAGTGAKVIVVRPGFVHTKMTTGMAAAPLACSADDVAAATVAALRTGREVVWVPGALRLVFLIFRHLPRAVWRRLPM